MARDITIIVTLQDATNHTAGLQVRTGPKTWRKFEPGGANHVFKTPSGGYRVLPGGGGSASTELLGAGASRFLVRCGVSTHRRSRIAQRAAGCRTKLASQ